MNRSGRVPVFAGILVLNVVLLAGCAATSPGPAPEARTTDGTEQPQGTSYITEDATSIHIGNELIELSFDKALKGGLDRIVHKTTGHDFRNDKVPPPLLFMLFFDNGIGTGLLVNWDATTFSHTQSTGADFATLTMTFEQLRGYAVDATVTATVRDGSALCRMRVTVENAEPFSLKQAVFPSIWGLGQIGAESSDDALLCPAGDGILIHDPLSHIDSLYIGEKYPSTASMQMMAYYDEDEDGLYTAAYDTTGQLKELSVSKMEWSGQQHLTAQWKHFIPESQGNDFAMEHDAVVGTFSGDWRDAGDVYREWAQTTPFVAGGRVFEDKDTPDWWRNTAILQMQNRDGPDIEIRSLPEIVDITRFFSDLTDLDATALINGWEAHGAFVGPYYYPPVEGEAAFSAAMADLATTGNRGFTYLSGTVWRTRRDDIGYADPGLFETIGRPWAARNEAGEPTFELGYEIIGWQGARMDPMTAFWHDMVVSNVLACVSLGVRAVQVDEFPTGSVYPCYDASHGHATGYTGELTEAYTSILGEIRQQGRALASDLVMSMEEPSEFYIPHMDAYVSRDNAPEFLFQGPLVDRYGDDMEFVPLFSWVYHEYITAFGESLPLDDSYPTVFYPQVARALASTFITGEIQNGSGIPEDELRPGLGELYGRTATASGTYANEYLIQGKPLVPPTLSVPSVEIQWYHSLAGRFGTPIHAPAVMVSAWEADDGDVGLALINWDESPHTFDLEIPAYDLPVGNYALVMTKNGETGVLLEQTALPVTVGLTMEKNDVVLIEILDAASAASTDGARPSAG